MRVPIALGVGLALIALAISVTLGGSPKVLIATNSIPKEVSGFAPGRETFCQNHEVVPAGATAVRVSVAADIGPRMTLRAFSGSQVITEGVRQTGWGSTETVTIPVRRVARSVEGARICVAIGPAVEPLLIEGASRTTTGAHGRKTRESKMRFEYLRPDRRSWWSLASTVARQMGLGHAPSGTWSALLVLALMAMVVALASWTVLRELRPGARPTTGPRGLPTTAWVCATLALASATCWSLITPPFQVPDEPAHFAYAQHLAETAHRPPASGAGYSTEETVALRDLHFYAVHLNPEVHTIASKRQQHRLETDLARSLDRQHLLEPPQKQGGTGASEVAASQPPLYYALEAIPYRLAAGGSLLDRLELMRLLGALMAALTALLSYLFVREVLPRSPWAWTVGGLSVALAPLLGYMSGAVNPDAMLCTVSAAELYCLARGFRRGLTPRLAIAIGAITAAGFLTKLNFVGVAPGVIVGLVVLTLRRARTSGAVAYRSSAVALGLALSPACVYALVNVLSNRPTLGLISGALDLTHRRGSILKEASYIWQLYLPRLPGMTDYFPGISTPRQIWFQRSVGLYGWVDTSFPSWVTNVALIPAALIAALALRALIVARSTLVRRSSEILVYALIALGVMALIGADSYLVLVQKAGEYTQPRYLLPLIPLLGVTLALAACGAGRRWAPVAGTLIVLLILAHEVFSQLLVISRYHG